MTLRERVLAILRGTSGLDDDEIGRRLKVDRHYVNGVCRKLVSEGLLMRAPGPGGKLVNRLAPGLGQEPADADMAIEAASADASITLQSPTIAEAIKRAKAFELHAKKVLSARWGVELEAREVRLTDQPEPKVKFDLVSPDGAVVGDAKFLKNIPVPAAKWSVIAEYVWLLQHAQNARRRFMVFGQDREVAQRWLVRYRPLTNGVEFYFLDGDQLTPI
jgi:hypothetical protein